MSDLIGNPENKFSPVTAQTVSEDAQAGYKRIYLDPRL